MLEAQPLLVQALHVHTTRPLSVIAKSPHLPASTPSPTTICIFSPSARRFGSTPFLRQLPLLLDDAIHLLQKDSRRFYQAMQEGKISLTDAEVLAQTIVNEVRYLAIPDQQIRIALAKFVMEHSPQSLCHHIERFNISDKDTLMDIFPVVYREDIRCNEVRNNYVNTLLASVGEIAERFFPYDTDLQKKALLEGITKFPNIHPSFLAILKNAQNEKDPHVKNILTQWAHFTCIAFRNINLSDDAWRDLELQVDAIRHLHVPTLRSALTEELARHYHNSSSDPDARQFRDFCKDFKKPHTLIFAPILFSLCASPRLQSHDYPLVKQLTALLQRQEFKDTKRQARSASSLMILMRANCIHISQQHQLLRAITPEQPNRPAAFTFLHSLQGLAALLSLSEKKSKFGDHVLGYVRSIRTATDLHNTLGIIYHALFGTAKEENDVNVVAHFDRYLVQSRQPTALLQFATKVLNELSGDEQKTMLESLRKFVHASVLSTDSNAFKRLRYDTTHSKHMRVIFEKTPDVFSRWQESHQYKLSEDEPSRTSARGLTDPHDAQTTTPKLTVIDSDAPEDLLLCGTELSGSCLNIHGEIRHTKALMGYVLDGKYRLIAAKAPDGRLSARRILRIMWDIKQQRPVLHLEHLYKDRGVSVAVEKAMIDLARQKAAHLGCTLVTYDKSVPTIGLHSSPMLSLGGQAPFEYVDALQVNHAISGREPYTLTNALVVADTELKKVS